MGFSRKDVQRMLLNVARAKSNEPAPAPRKPRGKGRVGIAKATFRVSHTSTGGLILDVPLYTTTEANTHGHWAAKAKRAEKQREIMGYALAGRKLPQLPASIKFTRIGKRKMDDDNLASSMKHIRDEIARFFGVDDGSDRYQWSYSQAIGSFYSVHIEIEPLNGVKH